MPFVDERTLLSAIALTTSFFFLFWGCMNFARTPRTYGQIGKAAGLAQIIAGSVILVIYLGLYLFWK